MHQGIVLDQGDLQTLLRGGRLTIRGIHGGDLDIWAAEQFRVRGPKPKWLTESMDATKTTNGDGATETPEPTRAGRDDVPGLTGKYVCRCGMSFTRRGYLASHVKRMAAKKETGHTTTLTSPPGHQNIACSCGETFPSIRSRAMHLNARGRYRDGRKHKKV